MSSSVLSDGSFSIPNSLSLNFTSRLKITRCLSQPWRRQPLVSVPYLRNTHFLAFELNCSLIFWNMCICSAAKTTKMLYIRSYPSPGFKGCGIFHCLGRILLGRYTVVFSASTPNFWGKLAWISMDSTRVLFRRSATPFCCGVLGTVNSCLTPSIFRKFWNSLDMNSPPLSVRRVF